jgi:hypothetical protein
MGQNLVMMSCSEPLSLLFPIFVSLPPGDRVDSESGLVDIVPIIAVKGSPSSDENPDTDDNGAPPEPLTARPLSSRLPSTKLPLPVPADDGVRGLTDLAQSAIF